MSNFYVEKEALQPLELCDFDGKLNKESIVWSRKPLITSNIRGHYLRKKKWNYWCIIGENYLFSATITNLDYAALGFVYYLDYNTKDFYEKTVITPFGKDCILSDEVMESASFKHRDLSMYFLKEEDGTRLIVNCPNFGGKKLKADIKIHYPLGHETLSVVIPWSSRKFQHTSKHNCLRAGGQFSVGDKTYIFHSSKDFACLDFGRGDWPRKVRWNWGTASGYAKDKLVGFNLGAKWTDGTGMTENAMVVDGKLYKISEDVKFQYDTDDFMRPWKLNTVNTDAIDLTFVPFYERVAKSNIGVVKSKVHQMIGNYSGTITTGSGEKITIENLKGCIEDHYGKW